MLSDPSLIYDIMTIILHLIMAGPLGSISAKTMRRNI